MSNFNNNTSSYGGYGQAQPESLVPSVEHGSAANTNGGLENAKNAVLNNASSAANTVKNHPITQNIANGPVATNVMAEADKTSNEFSNLAAARQTPSKTASTGQPLTHYHSFFTTLLSWNNPRASGIAYASIVLFIFSARYLNVLRYALKLTWWTLGVTVLAEVVGQAVLGTGLTSQFRPKKYYTLSKDTLNAVVGDVHELINFFVIESQRILFVENTLVSGAAAVAALVAFLLIGLVPFWGLSLIATSVVFLAPLIYKSNKELIDGQLNKAASIANQQSEQVRKLAAQQAARATETTKAYVGDYSAKAQDLIGNAKRSVSPSYIKSATTSNTPSSTTTKSEPFGIKKENAPSALSSLDSFPTSNKQENVPTSFNSFHASTQQANAPSSFNSFPASTQQETVPSSLNDVTIPTSSLKQGDFPLAPSSQFQAPTVGQTVTDLRRDDEPLFAA